MRVYTKVFLKETCVKLIPFYSQEKERSRHLHIWPEHASSVAAYNLASLSVSPTLQQATSQLATHAFWQPITVLCAGNQGKKLVRSLLLRILFLPEILVHQKKSTRDKSKLKLGQIETMEQSIILTHVQDEPHHLKASLV